jgi:hypothetical protein
MRLSISTTKTLEMLHEAFREHFLSHRVVFECHSHFEVSSVSAQDDKCSGQPSTSKTTANVDKKIENSSIETIAEESMSLPDIVVISNTVYQEILKENLNMFLNSQ